MNKTEAIKNFLQQNATPELAKLYNHSMEVQVLVAPGEGEKITGEYNGIMWQGYTDGINTWKNIRIPFGNGNYEDSQIRFDLQEHAREIGLSGWDWEHKKSLWVVFDFDHIIGHKERHAHKLTDEKLKQVEEAAKNIPWVTVRRSTRGRGLHLYVFFEGVETESRQHHAALARAVLSEMSYYCDFPFNQRVDVCGQMAWVWSQTQAENGFELIKEATEKCPEPTNWQNHLNIVKGTKSYTYDESISDLVKNKNGVFLDDEHKRLIDWLRENERFCTWNMHESLLITHTIHLRDAHRALGLKGIFNTNSAGTDTNKQNCFLYPIENGGWRVCRYGKGTEEHNYWEQDGINWTTTLFNKIPSFEVLCEQLEGMKDEKGDYHFTGKALKTILRLFDFELPESLEGRPGKLKKLKDGEVQVIIDNVTQGCTGWIMARGKKATKVLATKNACSTKSYDINEPNVRALSSNTAIVGWAIKTKTGTWLDCTKEIASNVLQSEGIPAGKIKNVLGSYSLDPWTLVTRPFENEYPGNRLWNRAGSKLKFTPEPGTYPTWKNILDHVGNQLTKDLESNPWFHQNGIHTGGDYLFTWIAGMFQAPYDSLPYLFIYSARQKTGKSMLHQALSKLFDPGVVRAHVALQNQADFNGELEGAILCVLEELKLNRREYNKIKDYVTSSMICLHKKYEKPVMVPNTTHWIHTSNDLDACPVFPGDSRITVVHVPEPPEVMLPQNQMFEQLNNEAPAFLHALFDYQLPPQQDRLIVPAVDSKSKRTLARVHGDELETFISEHLVPCNGHLVEFDTFYSSFLLTVSEAKNWKKTIVRQKIPFSIGKKVGKSKIYIANVRWSKDKELIPEEFEYRLDSAGCLRAN